MSLLETIYVEMGFKYLLGGLAQFSRVGGNYSARTHFYAVEYLKPSAGTGNLSILNVTFNRKLDAKTADRVLREEPLRAIVLFPPRDDVMAYVWTQTDPSPGSEKMIAHPDGSHFLIYFPKTKQTQTEKQYDLSNRSLLSRKGNRCRSFT